MVVANSEDNGGMKDFQFHRAPRTETKWQTLKRIIYDPATKEVLGRTGKSWGQLLIFYAIFYVVLGAMFAICMQGLFATISDKEPKWQLDKSLIGTNPGLGFRPISDNPQEGSLIWYNLTNQTQITKWIRLADKFLEPYKANQTGENYVNCNLDRKPDDNKVCVTDVSNLGPCNRNRGYGYNTSSPCIFLKLNRIYGWVPNFYKNASDKMPQDLRDHIESLANQTNKNEMNQIWVSCNGQGDVDKEHVKGFKYYPRGFAGYYYPYKNTENYLSPIIAVEIINVTPNVIVSIECRSWAENINYSGSTLNRIGSVQFEILVDAAKPVTAPSITAPTKPTASDNITITKTV